MLPGRIVEPHLEPAPVGVRMEFAAHVGTRTFETSSTCSKNDRFMHHATQRGAQGGRERERQGTVKFAVITSTYPSLNTIRTESV